MQEKVKDILRKDPIMANLIQSIEPKVDMTNSTHTTKDIYFALLDSIVSQQLSVKAADTIFKRFLNLFPNQYPAPDLVIAAPIEQLRSVGLSFQKASYLKNTAQFFSDNDLDYDSLNAYSDIEIIKMLTNIIGIGQWTVEMLLMFVMHREDVFPYDDLVVRNNIIKLYKIEGKGADLKRKVLAVADQWRPYRTIACKYIWRWKDVK